MVQDQKPTVTIGNRNFTVAQLMGGIVALLIAIFLIYGTVNGGATDSPAVTTAPTQSFVLLALLAFAGGLFSFLSPCTLPILPAYFAFAFRSGKATIAANTLAFMLGLATMFSVFGAGASTLGSVLYQRQDLILLFGGALIIVFGIMSVLGMGFTGSMGATQQQRSTSVGGSFVFGLTFAVGWSSCVGPILGVILALAATTASVIQGMMLLFIYALGLGLPLMIVSAFFGRQSRDSFVWRMMRGKGTERIVSTKVVALIWAVGLWLIAMPVVRQFIPALSIDANPLFTIPLWHSSFSLTMVKIVLLILLVAGAIVYDSVRNGGGQQATLHLHSTSIVSGVLFLLMGLLLINAQLGVISSFLESTDFSFWLLDLEQNFLSRFGQ